MRILDSRRLTGPGLLLDTPGAVLDIELDDALRGPAVAKWERAARQLLNAVGWTDEKLASRVFHGGVSLAFSAPVDGLYAATEINEQAWMVAAAELEGGPAPDFHSTATQLSGAVAAERNPRLVGLREAARSRGLTFLSDGNLASIGSGTGARVWPVRELPEPSAVEWANVHDIPMVLVTGSNGKTTVVRLIASMVKASGQVPGTTSTDGVQVGSATVAEGDFSGPEGARLVLRRPEVQTAILETARGGILRRGITVDHADVAVITNIAEDHLGEFGVESLKQLAETKLLVGKAVAAGYLVLNADDPVLVEASSTVRGRIIWFALDAASPVVRAQVERGSMAVTAEEGSIVLATQGQRTEVIRASEVPITFGGAARYNIANVMAAVAAGAALGITVPVMREALRTFGRSADDNPGRANLIEVGGARVLMDYAHNPHGMTALVGMAQRIPAQRRLLMLGQAGDRKDDAIRELARAASKLRPDHVIVKDAAEYLRGRTPGEVPGLLADEFTRLGTPASSISQAPSEIAGVRQALAWARPGDLLVMAVHQDRRQIMGLFSQLDSAGWQVGRPLPEGVKA